MRFTVLCLVGVSAACSSDDEGAKPGSEIYADAGDARVGESDPDANDDSSSDGGPGNGDGDDAGEVASSCVPADCVSGYCFSATHCSAAPKEIWWSEEGTQQLSAWAFDDAGNRYVAYTEPPPAGSISIYPFEPKLSKFGPNLEPIWSRNVDAAAQEAITAMVVDKEGHLFTLSVAMGPVDGQKHAGSSDWVVSRFSPEGVREWTRQLGSADSDWPNHLTLVADGTLWIAGSWGMVNKAPTKGAGVVAQLSASGEELRRFSYGTIGRTNVGRVALDDAGHIFITGSTQEAFGSISDPSVSDIFVMRLKGDGSLEWTLQLTSQWGDSARYAIADGEGGVWIAGDTNGDFETLTSTGLTDALVFHVDAGGKLDWTVPVASPQSEFPDDFVRAPDGDLLLTGRASQGIDPKSPQDSAKRAFVARIATTGMLRSVQRFGVGNEAHAVKVAATADGVVHVATTSQHGGATGVDIVFEELSQAQ